jgi:hypothetical protein
MSSKHKSISEDKAIAEALDRDGKIYSKTGEYRAVRVEAPTPVETILANGMKETKNTALPGDYILTGVGGERYVVKPDVLEKRYEKKPGRPGVYLARGHVKAIENPFDRPLHILAPWGEVQHGAADCIVADTYDLEAKKRGGKPYLIARAEFDASYRIAGLKTPWYRKKAGHPRGN